MTDIQFQKAINKATKKLNEYHAALEIAEEEYKRRFGTYPSDVDDDNWIDAMHLEGFGITVEEVTKGATI